VPPPSRTSPGPLSLAFSDTRTQVLGTWVTAASDAADEAVHSPLALRRRWLSRLLEAATDALDPANPGAASTAETLLAARISAWQHEASWLEGDRG
jgi:hypothetical protein